MRINLGSYKRPIIFAPTHQSAEHVARIFGLHTQQQWVYGNASAPEGRTPDEYVLVIYNPSLDHCLDVAAHAKLHWLRDRWTDLWDIMYVDESDLP